MEKNFMTRSFSGKRQLVENFLLKKIIGLKTVIYICCSIFLLIIAGCRPPGSVLERDYGNSWAYNEAVQIADPKAAALNQTPATGLEPQASVNVMGSYNKSFAGSKSDAGKSTTINLGGLTTAGGGGGN